MLSRSEFVQEEALHSVAFRLAATAAVGVFALAGCSSSEDEWSRNLPETVPAEGVVLLDGKPVEGAVVVFSPVAPGKYPAQGVTDTDGEFSLKAFPSKEGAVAGSYQVGVTKNVEKPTGKARKENFGPDAEHAADLPPPSEWENLLPNRYANPANSGLTMEIPADGTSELKIELKSGS